jgi:hypothetical protein
LPFFSVLKPGTIELYLSGLHTMRPASHLFLAICSFWLSGQPGLCLSASQIDEVVGKEKIFGPETKLTPFVDGDEAVLRVHQPVTARSDPDTYKINAALAAKAIVGADKSISKVLVRYYTGDAGDNYKQVVVRSVDVKAFGSRAISEDDLLKALEIQDGSDAVSKTANAAGSEAGLAAGPMQTERRALLGRIEGLKARGVGVKPFMDRFNALEAEAGKGDVSNLGGQIEALSDSVSDQEKTLAQRTHAEHRPERPAVVAQTPKSPPAVPEAAGTQEQGSLMEEFLNSGLKNLIPAHWQILVPAKGPFFNERQYIATKIGLVKESGYPVSQYMEPYHKMDALAAANKADDVQRLLPWFYKALNINPEMAKQGQIGDMIREMHRLREERHWRERGMEGHEGHGW